MLSFNEKDRETIYSIYPRFFEGSNLFPIASDAAGNFICYDLKIRKFVLLNHENNQTELITEMVHLV